MMAGQPSKPGQGGPRPGATPVAANPGKAQDAAGKPHPAPIPPLQANKAVPAPNTVGGPVGPQGPIDPNAFSNPGGGDPPERRAPTKEETAILEAEERSDSGNVFRVEKDIIGFAIGDIIAQEDLPKASDDRTLRAHIERGTLVPVNGLRADLARMPMDPRHLDEVQGMQVRIEQAEQERDSAEKTIKLLEQDNTELKSQLAEAGRQLEEARKEIETLRKAPATVPAVTATGAAAK